MATYFSIDDFLYDHPQSQATFNVAGAMKSDPNNLVASQQYLAPPAVVHPAILTSPQSSYAESEDSDHDEPAILLPNEVMTRTMSASSNVNTASSSTSKRRPNLNSLDDDERLLQSEEGKKLSSKERRQLRNKVSARHFRLRRKEYITHLEQLVAEKSTEGNMLRSENDSLRAENKKLIEALSNLSLNASTSPEATSTSASYISTPESIPGSSIESASDIDFFGYQQSSSSSSSSQAFLNDLAEYPFEQQQQHHEYPQQEPSRAPRINPRIVNLLPTFNSTKDTNPNLVEWPLAYGVSSTAPGLPLSNMQVFNTLIPESLAELEKEQDEESDSKEQASEDKPEEPKTTVTVEVLSSKPDKEESCDKSTTPLDQEGIWEDARKAAEEVYKRLGVHLAGLSLEENA
ncbi:hypothetical protein V1514DRAFT_298414 [Lipomyces japonicus]|uniref:uncharacterized protein n=1 Tax=Lipomyces japonicus TaxID=56871 RepID=UPI0034CF6FAA